MEKVLIVVGDATETLDTMYPYYRLIEAGFQPVVTAPEKRLYQMVLHEVKPNWTITKEWEGYTIQCDVPFCEVKEEEYAGNDEHVNDVRSHEVAHSHHKERGARQLLPRSLEHLGEDRDDKNEQQRDNADCNGDDNPRIDHCSLDFSSERFSLFKKDGEPAENRVQDTACLAGVNEVHEKVIELLGMVLQRIGEG